MSKSPRLILNPLKPGRLLRMRVVSGVYIKVFRHKQT